MRLWHYKLIPALPRQQLIAQWRECCCIMKNIADNGTPNHILVNKVLDYISTDFICYTGWVIDEMKHRGYNVSPQSIGKFNDNMQLGGHNFFRPKDWIKYARKPMFDGWHTQHYLTQCYYNLQEKYDCGGITDEEWAKIENVYAKGGVRRCKEINHIYL